MAQTPMNWRKRKKLWKRHRMWKPAWKIAPRFYARIPHDPNYIVGERG